MGTVTGTVAVAGMVAAAAVFAPGCNGTEVGNPIVDVDFALYNESIDPDPQTPEGDVAVAEAWVAVDRIRIRPAADCEGDAELEIAGPLALDLLAPGTLPELTGLPLAGGDYCRFELRWSAAAELPAGAPPALAGAAVLLEGTRGDGTAFSLRSERNDELRLDAVGGAFAIDEATAGLFVAFDGARLLAGVDLDAATPNGDGVIVIDEVDNTGLLDIFDDNLSAAADLFRDDDGDGALDDGERDPDDSLAR